jgi:hypothetical protein
VAHPGLYRELDYERYRAETFRHYPRQHAPIRPLRTGIYDRGRFSVTRENAVRHVQRLYTEYLAR